MVTGLNRRIWEWAGWHHLNCARQRVYGPGKRPGLYLGLRARAAHDIVEPHKLSYSFDERNALLNELGVSKYPLMDTVRVSEVTQKTIPDVVTQYCGLRRAETSDQQIQTWGRIRAIRRAGKGLMFLDLTYGDSSLQAVLNRNKIEGLTEDDESVQRLFRVGDAVSVVGTPGRTKTGELSLLARLPARMLSPCLRPLPEQNVGLEVRQHNRVAELKIFNDARQQLRARDAVINAVTQFLRTNGFLQVQTPILSAEAGGANAEPFLTKEGFALRIAPELWLKKLIIGGFDKVFEVGPSFRNEGIDTTHNPEFTTCEFYMTFATLKDLMDITQSLITHTLTKVIEELPDYAPNVTPILNAEWQTVDFISAIEEACQKPLPPTLDEASLKVFLEEQGLSTQGSAAKLLDRLAATYIEPHCQSPTFLTNQPAVMAPLAKCATVEINGNCREVSRRFELLIGGTEYVNAYEEENDPVQQRLNLQGAQDSGEHPDQSYLEAMEWGLPPTGGWGMGLDRLTMLVTNSSRIHDVLSFGGLKKVYNN